MIFLCFMFFLTCKDISKNKVKIEPNDTIKHQTNEADQVSMARFFLENNQLDSATLIYKNLLSEGDLSYYYDIGNFLLTKNDINGLLYIDSVAILGDNSSALILAFLYENGKSDFLKGNINVEPDLNKAIYYYKLASESGDPLAQLNLGMLYYDSINNFVNIDSSKHYLLKCINNKTEDELGSSDVAKKYYNNWFQNN